PNKNIIPKSSSPARDAPQLARSGRLFLQRSNAPLFATHHRPLAYAHQPPSATDSTHGSLQLPTLSPATSTAAAGDDDIPASSFAGFQQTRTAGLKRSALMSNSGRMMIQTASKSPDKNRASPGKPWYSSTSGARP
ncbi:unnamed protein product, partial [Amoebophrya sp. A25]